MSRSSKWLLLFEGQPQASLQDEFISGPFRLRLTGGSLEVEYEGHEPDTPSNGQDEQLARSYVDALQQWLCTPIRRVTHDELAAMPAWAFPSGADIYAAVMHNRDPSRIAAALRRARRALVSSEWSALVQCYDYLQDAAEGGREQLFALYKLVETIEHELGGERGAIVGLRMESQVKGIKRLANEHSRDERHAPKDPLQALPLSEDQRQQALEWARQLVRAFELHVRSESERTV